MTETNISQAPTAPKQNEPPTQIVYIAHASEGIWAALSGRARRLQIAFLGILLVLFALLLWSSTSLFGRIQGPLLRDLFSPHRRLAVALPPQDIAAIRDFSQTSQAFGLDRLAIIGLRTAAPLDVFLPQMTRFNRRFTARLKKIDGIHDVLSLASGLSIHKTKGTMEVRPLLPKDLRAYDVRALRRFVLHDPLMRGSLVSLDGRTTLFLCLLRQDADIARLALQILAQVEKARTSLVGGELFVTGLPLVGPSLLQAYLQEARRIAPWLLAIGFFFLLCLFACSTNPKLGLLAIVWVFLIGSLGATTAQLLATWITSSFQITSFFLPLFAWSIAFWWGLQISPWGCRISDGYTQSQIDHYRHRLYLCLGFALALGAAILAFFGSPLWSQFGATLAWASLCTSLWAGLFFFVGIPAPTGNRADTTAIRADITTIRADTTTIRADTRPAPTSGRADTRPAPTDARSSRSLLVSVAFLGLFLLGMLGISRLSVYIVPEYYYPAGDVARAEAIQKQAFGGALPFFLRFQGDLGDPIVLKSMERIGRRLELLDGFAQPQSIAILIGQLNRLLDRFPRVPDDRRQVASLWMFLDGQAVLKNLVHPNRQDGILQLRLHLPRRVGSFHPWLAQIQHALRDAPLRYQAVSWHRASSSLRRALLRQRARWIAEGLLLWSQRYTHRAFSHAHRLRLERLLLSSSQSLIALGKPNNLPKEQLLLALRAYLASEACDLELGRAEQERVLSFLLRWNAEGKGLGEEGLKMALTTALAKSKVLQDRSGVGYALKALSQIVRRVQLAAETRRLQEQVLSVMGVAAKAVIAKADARLALQAELMEIHNPNWVRFDRGPQRLKVTPSGLHPLLISLGEQSLQWLVLLVWALALAFLAILLLVSVSSAKRALDTVSGGFFAMFATLSAMGWWGYSLEPVSVLALSMLFVWSPFAASLVYERTRLAGRFWVSKSGELWVGGWLYVAVCVILLRSSVPALFYLSHLMVIWLVAWGGWSFLGVLRRGRRMATF